MTSKLSFKQSLIAGLLAGIAAAVINTILFLVFHATGVISDNIYVKPGQPMTIVPVVMASIIPSLVAGMIFFVFEKFTNDRFKIFAIVATVLMALSLFSPFTVIPGVTIAYALALCIMHIVVTACVLYFIYRAKQNSVVDLSH
jgi:hypothetical protein